MSTKMPVFANSADRPDILTIRIHLARLEEHYAVLELQRARAEGRCNRVANHPDGVNEAELFRAELFANRIESQIHRALKELHKTELELRKFLADESEAPTMKASGGQESFEIPSASLLVTGAVRESPPILTAVNSIAARPHEPPTPIAVNLEQTALNDTQRKLSPNTPDEFKNITARYRHRILSTPVENRPALIARLVEEHRAKNAQAISLIDQDIPMFNAPKPSQNGKHAA